MRRANELEARLERQKQAWRLYCAGATFQQIGDHLKVTAKTAWTDCVAVKDRMLTESSQSADLIRTRQHARLDDLHAQHYKTRTGKASADVLLRIADREAKLFGLDAPTKAQHVVATLAIDQEIGGLSIGDIEAKIANIQQVLRHALPAAEAPVIDVAPVASDEAAYAQRLAARSGRNGNGNNGGSA